MKYVFIFIKKNVKIHRKQNIKLNKAKLSIFLLSFFFFKKRKVCIWNIFDEEKKTVWQMDEKIGQTVILRQSEQRNH